MRLIDADLLIQDTIQEYARSKQYRDAVIRMVNKAHTIEPKREEDITNAYMNGYMHGARDMCKEAKETAENYLREQLKRLNKDEPQTERSE